MSIVLARIDDRLIHGQVTVGWNQQLRPQRIVLANDAVASDPWQKRVYTASVPPQIAVTVLDVAAAADLLAAPGEAAAVERRIVLTATPGDMLELVRAGVALPEINIGGMHHVPGKHALLPYLYVDATDLAYLRALLRAGSRLVAQQVPGGRELTIDEGVVDAMEGRL